MREGIIIFLDRLEMFPSSSSIPSFLQHTDSFEYEQQMLYLEGLGNLQLENVAEYLDPIIRPIAG